MNFNEKLGLLLVMIAIQGIAKGFYFWSPVIVFLIGCFLFFKQDEDIKDNQQ